MEFAVQRSLMQMLRHRIRMRRRTKLTLLFVRDVASSRPIREDGLATIKKMIRG